MLAEKFIESESDFILPDEQTFNDMNIFDEEDDFSFVEVEAPITEEGYNDTTPENLSRWMENASQKFTMV